jgi:hypothetical protein
VWHVPATPRAMLAQHVMSGTAVCSDCVSTEELSVIARDRGLAGGISCRGCLVPGAENFVLAWHPHAKHSIHWACCSKWLDSDPTSS